MGFFHRYWTKNDSRTGGAYHSHAFHGFFEGYVERTETDPATGKTKIVRIYTAPYFVHSGPKSDQKRSKLVVALLYAISLAAFIVSTSILEMEDPAKYYQFFVAVSFIFYFYVSYILIKYLSAPRKMTIGQFKSFSPKLYKACLIVAVFVFASVVMRIVDIILSPDLPAVSALMGTMSLLASGLTMLCLHFYERKTVYERLDNENVDAAGIPIME